MPHKPSFPNEDIIRYLINYVEPLPDSAYGPGYRAAVTLVDGTYLPCVIFRNPKTIVDLAIRRFDEEKRGKGVFSRSSGLGYPDIVKNFVTNGNCINSYDVAKVEKSPYAIPKQLLQQIRGETLMGWTGFVARMKDGKHFGFGTSFSFSFFNLPEGYSYSDVSEIINHSYINVEGNVEGFKGHSTSGDFRANSFREKIYFECFLDGL